MRAVQFSPDAYKHYQEWRKQNNREVFEKINDILNDTLRDPFKGLGKTGTAEGKLFRLLEPKN